MTYRPKKPPQTRTPGGLADYMDGVDLYTDGQISTIIEASGKQPKSRAELKSQLNKAAHWAKAVAATQKPPPWKIAKYLAASQRAAKKLLYALGQHHSSKAYRFRDEIKEHLSEAAQPGVVIDSIFEAVASIQKLARQAERRAKSRKRKTNSGDIEHQTLFSDLCKIYVEQFDAQPGASVNPNTRKVGGPFVRFVQAAYEPLGIQRAAGTIPKDIQDWRSKESRAKKIINPPRGANSPI